MAVKIRLMRYGKKAEPHYRVIVLDERKKRDGAYLEAIGVYKPLVQPHVLEINKERLKYWLSVGAVLSEGLKKLRVSV